MIYETNIQQFLEETDPMWNLERKYLTCRHFQHLSRILYCNVIFMCLVYLSLLRNLSSSLFSIWSFVAPRRLRYNFDIIPAHYITFYIRRNTSPSFDLLFSISLILYLLVFSSLLLPVHRNWTIFYMQHVLILTIRYEHDLILCILRKLRQRGTRI